MQQEVSLCVFCVAENVKIYLQSDNGENFQAGRRHFRLSFWNEFFNYSCLARERKRELWLISFYRLPSHFMWINLIFILLHFSAFLSLSLWTLTENTWNELGRWCLNFSWISRKRTKNQTFEAAEECFSLWGRCDGEILLEFFIVHGARVNFGELDK